MQLTQIFFDWIQADGKTWAAVIDHSRGGPTFHSLRGTQAADRKVRPRRTPMNVVAAAGGDANPSDRLAMFVVRGQEAVMCAKDAD